MYAPFIRVGAILKAEGCIAISQVLMNPLLVVDLAAERIRTHTYVPGQQYRSYKIEGFHAKRSPMPGRQSGKSHGVAIRR